jgi:hypothetical protein
VIRVHESSAPRKHRSSVSHRAGLWGGARVAVYRKAGNCRYGATVVVDEGEFEPRSIGSYALRVYEGASNKNSTDNFVAGLIRRRNGAVEAVRLTDIDGDQRPEIIVVIRSVGSGGYISADAFRYRLRSLQLIASVADLEANADPVLELRDVFKFPEEEP